MALKWYIITFFCVAQIHCQQDLDVILKTRSSYLEKYSQYSDVTIMRFVLPEDTLFAAFKFVADEQDGSIFGCSPRNISVVMKYGAPPVINPDGTKFPKLFKNISRAHQYDFVFKSDKASSYINLTSPLPGSYYVASFLPYSDPRKNAIKQQGLSSECFASMDCTVYIKKANITKDAVDNKKFTVSTIGNESVYYKLHVPDSMDYATVTLNNIIFSKYMTRLNFSAQGERVPSRNGSVSRTITTLDKQPVYIKFPIEEDSLLYLQFQFIGTIPGNTSVSTEFSSLDFSVKFFSTQLSDVVSKVSENDNNSSFIQKLHYSSNISSIMPYNQFNLVREASTESLLFSYELEAELQLSRPVPINLTSDEYIALKFPVVDVTDIGGTLQYILAFKPRIKKVGSKKVFKPEPENHVILACINRGTKLIPVWPDKCVDGEKEYKSPLIINKKDKNATMLVPYPETGPWYATFRLFCGECEPCNCTKTCDDEYESCVDTCLNDCNSDAICNNCVRHCRDIVISKESCKGCDCDGRCMRSTETCNSSVIFDISSQSCIQGDCGKTGKCMLVVSDGIVYSSCVCYNNYRGWDCSDNSLANPYWMVVLELLLLVLSNLMFLPAVYVAYRRKYYIEALCYFSICFFSTFYHACDAGEHLISFCITRLSSLQFADFFCALFAIWVTLIAIADLPSFVPSICHIAGAIILSFCTTINKTALWIFAFPAIIGVVIILVSWYMKYRKVKQMFLKKRYLYINLPIGVVLVTLGLVIYTALQTENNYMYLHSMWHIIMAVALLILLPKEDTFHPEFDL